MKPQVLLILTGIGLSCFACNNDQEGTTTTSEEQEVINNPNVLPTAFAEFDDETTTVYLDGDDIVIESNGWVNHTSPYWSDNHVLNIDPIVTSTERMAPGNIDNFNGSYTLRIPFNPTKASNTTATQLGPIGIAVSGGMIYNDREGGNVPIDNAAPSLDYTGGHTGPQSYHYHIEPKAWSEDDTELIGVIADGFLLYGRKCAATGTYPTDLDESGGHIGTTQHNDTPHYHYHIMNEAYLNQYYLLFTGNYQGSPSAIR